MRKTKDILSAIALCALIILLMFAGLFIGSVDVRSFDSNSLYIIWNIRLPRVLMCVLTGGGLAICGAAYQAIFRNPLSDPYTLGVSSGASLGAALAIVLGLEGVLIGTGGLAFLFALLTVWIIVCIASVGSRIHTTTLLLAGTSINFLIAALIAILMVTNAHSMEKIIFWTLGSLSFSKMSDVYIVAIFVFIAFIVLLFYAKDLNALLMGSDTAHCLGIDVEKTKKVILLFTTLMIGVIVSFCGVIGFVGLIVPHIIRLLVGADNRRIIPFSFLGGAIFMLLADIVSRTIAAPSELPIGAITALVGAPFFIYLLYNAKRNSLFNMEQEVISIKNLNYSIGSKDILSHISFSLKEGGFYALLGTNGSGKSTLLRSMNGNLTNYSGEILIGKRNIKKYPPKILARQVSTVSQRTEFMFDFSALQVVMMGRMCHQKHLQEDSLKDKEIVDMCMEKTNTYHLKDRFIKQLSGGELQRVMIARALAQQSPIMLLDEPVSSLDILHSFEIMELLHKINEDNHTTILIVLHNLSLAYQYAKECLILEEGKLKAQGETKSILTIAQIEQTFGVSAQIIENQVLLLPKR